MRLQGKVGIITAAASGMGQAGALRFAKEGASVAVVDRDGANVAAVVSEIKAAGRRAIGLVGDLTDEAFSRSLVASTVEAFGQLNFLWNHVGHPGPSVIEGIKRSDLDLAIDLNLRSGLLTTEAALPELRKHPGGNILFTSSVSGLNASAFSPVYSMVKFGVVGLTKSLAKRFAPEGIRVNAICPGSVDTPMLRVFVARPDQVATRDQDPEKLVASHTGKSPMGRSAQPEEIANVALFLVSDEASFVSGAAIPVDGASSA